MSASSDPEMNSAPLTILDPRNTGPSRTAPSIHSPVRPYVHASIRSYVFSSSRPYKGISVRQSVYSSVRPCVYLSVRAYVCSSARPYIRSFAPPFVRCSVRSSARPSVFLSPRPSARVSARSSPPVSALIKLELHYQWYSARTLSDHGPIIGQRGGALGSLITRHSNSLRTITRLPSSLINADNAVIWNQSTKTE